jgi:hypothetical protein
MPRSYIWVIVFYDEAVKDDGDYDDDDDDAKFWGYVGANAERLSVEFCNFFGVIPFFLNYLTYYY